MKTYDELTADILVKAKAEKARRRRVTRRVCAGVTAFTLVLGGVLAAHLVNRGTLHPSLPTLELPDVGISSDKPDSIGQTLSTRSDYSDIYKCILTDTSGLRGNGYSGYMKNEVVEQAADKADHSETNIQVEGVDESDAARTDGKYIYAVSHRNVYIISAKDGMTQTVSKIPYLNEDGSLVTKDGEGDAKLYRTHLTPELYVVDDRLILTVQATDGSGVTGDVPEKESNGEMVLYDSLRTPGHDYLCAMIFNISDLDAPSLLSTVAISGTSVSTRLTDARLYLVSSDSYYGNSGIDEDDPATYIPKTVINGQKYLVGKNSVFCGNDKVECEYLNVTEVDVQAGEVSSSLSLLGYNGDVMYQSRDSIFVARTDYREFTELTETGADADSTRTEKRTSTRMTSITKISIGNGLSLEASAEFEGYPENSFSMDEYNGYLRVVLSVDKHSNMYLVRDQSDEYGEHIQDEYGEYVQNSFHRETSNSLYVLDSALNIVGSLTGLAPDERIYSCRFEGDDAYFVTYRQTDPLFHADLSDPANPVIVDELKIPGYSEYLQRFGELLFGFGVTDEGTLKLSMFSENGDGTMEELATTVIDGAFYSDALHDHHAILADSERNIIAFATTVDNGSGIGKPVYYIFSFDDGKFTAEAQITLADQSYASDSIRGLYIGNFFYIYQNSPEKSAVTSYALNGFTKTDEEIMDKNTGV